jgi:hypothetical protein
MWDVTEDQMLVLHIGLPKTATTFLQYKIFKPAVRRRFLHHRASGDGEAACKLVREYVEGGDAKPDLATIVDILKSYAGPKTTIVTDETISVHRRDFWSGEGATPSQAVARLGELRAALKDLFPQIGVLIGLRRQDTWLASRYAQSSKSMKGFCQEDFDRRAREIAGGSFEGSSWEWMDYSVVRSLFIAEFGEENMFFYSMEKLRDEPDQVLAEMGRFAGGLDFVAYRNEAMTSGEPMVTNTLSAGEDIWTLARDEGELKLPAEIKSALMARFAASNAALGKHIDLRFD